jgi:hypothetical protein
VSLILDALRKLERDKERPDPGVVVVGPVAWQGLPASRRAPLAAGLLAVLAVAGVWLAWRSLAPPAAVPPPQLRSSTPAAAAVPAMSPAAIRATPSWAPPARLDPPTGARRLAVPAKAASATSARSEPAPRPGPLQLMAISERDGQPIAIISDHLVHEGDSFDGIRILRIGQTEVEVEERGQRRVLRF